MEERNLRLRLSEYETHWVIQDEDGVWSMLSLRLRGRHANDVLRFSSAIRKAGESLMQLEAQEVLVEDTRAVVRAKVTFRSLTGSQVRTELEEQFWVRESGKWFYDGCRVPEGETRVGWDAH
jgi:hypothetical protein